MATCSISDSSQSDSDCSHIPSVIERLGQLRPSKELLEYYRKKVAEFDDDQQQILEKLEKYKSTYEEQHKIQWELRQREDEVAELQKALSDMQVFLFQERENVLRLFAENDRLKIQNLEDRKKIQHLLSLTCPNETEITYFIKGHPSNIALREEMKKPSKQSARSCSPVIGHRDRLKIGDRLDRGPGGHKTPSKERKSTGSNKTKTKDNIAPFDTDRDMLVLQIEALQAQLEEKVNFSNDQVSTLVEDRKVRIEEQQAQRERDAVKMKSLTETLKKTQTLLYESTKDYLELKYESRLKERKWMNERDKIMQEIDYLKEKLDFNQEGLDLDGPLQVNAGTQMHHSREAGESAASARVTNQMVIKQLRSNLDQTQNMAELYREQVIGLEDELARIREEHDVGKDMQHEKIGKLTKRLQVMKQRYDSLEQRRGLEVEGFKNDVKMLRARLKDVEKKLFKVTVNLGEQFDWEILQNVHTTAHRSKKLASDLHGLKTKVYEMERELRNL